MADWDALKESITGLKDNSRHIIEAAFCIAQSNRAYFEALVEKGFTEKQALELTKVHGISLTGK